MITSDDKEKSNSHNYYQLFSLHTVPSENNVDHDMYLSTFTSFIIMTNANSGLKLFHKHTSHYCLFKINVKFFFQPKAVNILSSACDCFTLRIQTSYILHGRNIFTLNYIKSQINATCYTVVLYYHTFQIKHNKILVSLTPTVNKYQSQYWCIYSIYNFTLECILSATHYPAFEN